MFKHIGTKYRQNLIFIVVISLLLIGMESYFRYSSPLLELFTRAREYLFVVIVVLLASFSNRRLALAFLTFIVTFIAIQLAHYNYFGTLLFPMEIYLGFTKQHEIIDTISTMTKILIVPVTLWLIALFVVIMIDRKTKGRQRYRWVSVIFVLILIFPIIRTSVGYKKHQLGERPNELWSLARNSIAVTDHFLGKTLPLLLLDKSTIPPWQEKVFVHDANSSVQNIVLIIGESLTSKHMSLYGYEKETTPYLDALAKQHKIIYRQGLSAGVVTDSSIPMIINSAQKANALVHIINGTNNLFKFAQSEGYHTYFITAQSQEALKYIRTYLHPNYIDTYMDSSAAGYDYFSIAHDDVLVRDFQKIPLKNRKNFIVLNMAGSHSPYQAEVPVGYKPFGDKKIVDQYDNSVHYSDLILHQLFAQAEKLSEVSTLFLFTSDHGELVSEEGFGHGRLDKESVYNVPLILYPVHTKLREEIGQLLTKSRYATHYELALIVADVLGYKSIRSDYKTPYKAYINGRDLNGVDGFMTVDYNQTAIMKREIH